MPTKTTARRPSGRRQPGRTPFKRLAAVPGRARKQLGSRPAALGARLWPKRSRARGKPGFLASIGKPLGELTSSRTHERSQRARKKRLAGLLAGGGTVAATAASAVFIHHRGRQQPPEQPAAEPAPPTMPPTTTHQQEEGDGQPGGDTTSTPPV
jgi:hypothetical protein